jgi:methyl-accepting chemotaxis protein
LVSVILGWLVAHFITYPLGKMLTLTESLASGDLSQNTDASGPLEIYKMATGLNSAVSGLQQIVVVINERADNLFSASKELKTASSETGQSAVQVAMAMEDLAKASLEQTNQINEAVEIINQLSNLVKKVSLEVEDSSSASDQVAQSAKLGQQVVSDIFSEVSGFYNSTVDIARVIDDLNGTSQEIGEAISVINGITRKV